MPKRTSQALAVAVILAAVLPAPTSGASAADRPRPACAEVPVARHPVELTSDHEDPAIREAMIVLGESVNPVRVIAWQDIVEMYARTPGAGVPPPGLIAFRAPGDASDPRIYVNGDSPTYTDVVRNPSPLARLKLAATLAHEQVHNTQGDAAAYGRQAEFVRDRLKTLPWRQWYEARRYLEALEARATALRHAAGCPAAAPLEGRNRNGGVRVRF